MRGRPTAAALLVAALLLTACGVPKPPPTMDELSAGAKAGDQGAIGALIEKMGRAYPADVRSEAYIALLTAKDADAKIIEAAKSSDAPMREHALALAANKKTPGAFEAAATALEDGMAGNFPRAHSAAWALGELGDARAIPLLVKALGAEAFKSSGPPLTLRESARALLRFGPKAVEPLLEAYPTLRGEAASIVTRVLGEFRDERVKPALESALEDPARRIDAVWALGTMGKIGEPVDLKPYLSDPEWRVRVEAARAVGLLSDDAALEKLDELRRGDPVIAVREWAARGTGLLTGVQTPFLNKDGEWEKPDSLYH